MEPVPQGREVHGVKAEATVECGGKLHRIEVTDKGRLRLCDHPRRFWKTLDMQQAVGMDCTCAEALRAWRQGWPVNGYPVKIPKTLISALNKVDLQGQQRVAD